MDASKADDVVMTQLVSAMHAHGARFDGDAGAVGRMMAEWQHANAKRMKAEQERMKQAQEAKEQEAKNEERVAAVNAVINPLSWNVPALPARDPASIAYATHHGQLDKVSRTVVERADRGFPVFR